MPAYWALILFVNSQGGEQIEEIKNIVIIGAGNVGSHLARHLHASGFNISRLPAEGRHVKATGHVKLVHRIPYPLKKVITGQDLYILALPDEAMEAILPQLALEQ